MASPVLVTGGTGRLGKLVVARLQDTGCDVRVLARHDRPTPRGVTFFTAGLRTGQGIEPAVVPFPELPIALEPLRRIGERLGLEPPWASLCFLAARDEPGCRKSDGMFPDFHFFPAEV